MTQPIGEAAPQDVDLELEALLAGPAEEAAAGPQRGGNRAPVVQGMQVTPAEKLEGQDVRVRAYASDPDGDDVSIRYTWLVNGEEVEAEGPVFASHGLQRGDSVQVRVVASDGRSDSDPVESPLLRVANAPPLIVSRPSGPGPDGVFRYQVEAQDPDGSSLLRYRLGEAPDGMTVSALGGAVEWAPRPEQTGVHAVEIFVEDAQGASTRQHFELTLSPPPAAAAP